jgi:hypothetical protein
MGKEVDWAREFDELDGAVEVDKIEIDWLEEFDKVTEEVESLSGYPGVAESELKFESAEDSEAVIERVIVEAEEEEKLSKGKGKWLRELLNKKVVLPVATTVGILGLIWGGSLLVEREGEVVSATATPIVESVEDMPGDTEIDWERERVHDFAESYGLESEAFLAGVGGEPDRTDVLNKGRDDWGESGTPESAGGTGTEIEAEPAPAPLANKVELAFNQTEYVLRPGDTMLSVAEEMKNDKLVSNQVEGLARLFKNNSWFSEGANFDRYKDYVSEIKTMIDVNPGVNPADITMGDGRTLAEWLIQVMHDVPVGLEIKI